MVRKSTLSYSESLRVIGQALEVLRIESFHLEKHGDKYIIDNWERSFLHNIAERVWGPIAPGQTNSIRKRPAGSLIYTQSDTTRLQAQEHAKRGAKELSKPATSLSIPLRILGDYLDRKRALSFSISWSMQQVALVYETLDRVPRQEIFTAQNLHDFGVGMYLRRSTRRSEE